MAWHSPERCLLELHTRPALRPPLTHRASLHTPLLAMSVHMCVPCRRRDIQGHAPRVQRQQYVDQVCPAVPGGASPVLPPSASLPQPRCSAAQGRHVLRSLVRLSRPPPRRLQGPGLGDPRLCDGARGHGRPALPVHRAAGSQGFRRLPPCGQGPTLGLQCAGLAGQATDLSFCQAEGCRIPVFCCVIAS